MFAFLLRVLVERVDGNVQNAIVNTHLRSRFKENTYA